MSEVRIVISERDKKVIYNSLLNSLFNCVGEPLETFTTEEKEYVTNLIEKFR